MRRHLKGFGLCGLALVALTGCDISTGDTTGPTQTVIVTQPTPAPTPAASPGSTPAPSGCPAVVRLTLGVTGGRTSSGALLGSGTKSAPAGSVLNLDITPRGADGQPVPFTAPLLCHDAAPLVSVVGPCTLQAQPNAFTPSLRLDSAGPCLVTATANGQVASDVFTVT